jgi:predicted aldo/keto reductase-like oxidoreductase
MKYTRREFIKAGVATTAAIAIDPKLAVSGGKNPYDAKGLPTTMLGKTGVRIPLIGIGTGTRFCSVADEDKAQKILKFALENGFYYWDTASIYGKGEVVAEERLGKMLKHNRKKIFLATKCRNRDADETKSEIECSLKRLQTDHLDLLQIHSIESVEDVKEITKKNGMYSVLQDMKEQGVTKFIGFSGHTSAQAMAMAAKEFEFDNMLIALNHYQQNEQKFEENAVQVAANKNMGVMAMKVVRPRETVDNLNPDDLIRYALSVKNITGAVIGIDSIEVLKKNKEILTNFKPLDDARMKELRMSLNPFYNDSNLEWLLPDYRDGLLT